MSKKHKHKHKHKQYMETEHTAPAPELSADKGAGRAPSRSANILPVLVLLLGIIIGVLVTSLILSVSLPKHVFASFLSEDETESDAAEQGVTPEGVNVAPGEASNTLQFVIATSSTASATSSSLSLKIPVMIYHSVRPYMKGESKYQDLYDVTPELLDQELTYIETHGYHPILMRDVDAYWRGATSSLPEKPVILTFDDGWKNQYEYAYPLLKKHHMTGVFYIFTNPIDHKKPHWMSWEEVIELDRAGMEIGGHTRTHPILTKIVDDAALDHEILEPKKIIETHLNHPIISFAYPFGAKDERVELAVARAGYAVARTTLSGVWNDPLHRLEFHGSLSSDKLNQFEWLLNKQ